MCVRGALYLIHINFNCYEYVVWCGLDVLCMCTCVCSCMCSIAEHDTVSVSVVLLKVTA